MKIFTLVYFDQRGSGKSKYDLSNKLNLNDLTYDVHQIIIYVKNRFISKKVYLLEAPSDFFICVVIQKR